MKIRLAMVALCSFLLHGCCSEKYDYLLISDDDFHRYMPYSFTDTLYFLHNGVDTEMFIGDGLIRSEKTIQRDDQGGCGPKTHADVIKCNFRNMNRPGKDLLFSEYFSYYQDNGYPDRYFNIKYGGREFGGSPADGLGSTNIGPTEKWNSDSIIINGKYHQYLSGFERYNQKQIFYNVEEGIIKIALDGDVLQIID